MPSNKETTTYKGIQITTRPAIDRPFDPDVAYYAEACHLFQSGGQRCEKKFQADGYSREEAIRNLRMKIEEFLIEREYSDK